MGIETKEKKIGEAVYSVTQLPARRSLRLKAKLIKMFGTSITQLLLTGTESAEKSLDEMSKKERENFLSVNPVDRCQINEMRKSSVVKGIQLLAETIDEKVFDELIGELLQGVRRDGVELTSSVIDHVFAGELMTLYHVIWFVLEVNYADFFALGGIGNRLEGLNPQATDTKKTYTYK